MTIQEFLFDAVRQRILRHLDIQFAMMVAYNDEPAVMLAAALLSRDTREGHVCLPLSKLVVDSKTPSPIQACFALVGTVVDWSQTLLHSAAVSDGSAPTPLVLRAKRLYLNRMWQSELTVSRFFRDSNQSLPYNKTSLSCILHELFGTKELVNWQKIATAVALTRRISIISGGPGTGKTTTIRKLLIALIQMSGEQKIRIRLVAPTGKAAARLTESLINSLEDLPLTEVQRRNFPKEASTLHHLLGVHPGRQALRYHSKNLLPLDVLVVDEASMIDLIMMSRLINAVPAHARVIFFGDRDQLASVEAGTVLGDICTYASKGYTEERTNELTQLTGCTIKKGTTTTSVIEIVRDSLCLLKKNYRFGKNSGIGRLASAINRNDYSTIKAILNGAFVDIRKVTLKSKKDYFKMLEEVLEGYLSFLRCAQQENNPKKALATFGQFQLLCAFREGAFGVTGLNSQLEQVFFKTYNTNCKLDSQWYKGRPIIISRNDNTLGLFNGDIGVTLDQGQGPRVWFNMPEGSIRSIHPNRLPEHETAWAMTIHKSQGSEFDHVALVLPPQQQTKPIVTRELIYTAITRARRCLSLYIDDRAFIQAVMTRTERQSGLKMILEKSI